MFGTSSAPAASVSTAASAGVSVGAPGGNGAGLPVEEEEPIQATIAVTEVCLGTLGLPSKFEGTPSSASQWREACEVFGLEARRLEPTVVQQLIGSQVSKYKLGAPRKDKEKSSKRPKAGEPVDPRLDPAHPEGTGTDPLADPAGTWQAVPDPGDQNSLEGSLDESL
jgi:hypothetical protein